MPDNERSQELRSELSFRKFYVSGELAAIAVGAGFLAVGAFEGNIYKFILGLTLGGGGLYTGLKENVRIGEIRDEMSLEWIDSILDSE